MGEVATKSRTYMDSLFCPMRLRPLIIATFAVALVAATMSGCGQRANVRDYSKAARCREHLVALYDVLSECQQNAIPFPLDDQGQVILSEVFLAHGRDDLEVYCCPMNMKNGGYVFAGRLEIRELGPPDPSKFVIAADALGNHPTGYEDGTEWIQVMYCNGVVDTMKLRPNAARSLMRRIASRERVQVGSLYDSVDSVTGHE